MNEIENELNEKKDVVSANNQIKVNNQVQLENNAGVSHSTKILLDTKSQILVLNENRFILKRNKFYDFLTSTKVYFQYFFKALSLLQKNLNNVKVKKTKAKKIDTITNEINYTPISHTIIVDNPIEEDIVAAPASVYEAENKKYDISSQTNVTDAALLAKSFELERAFGFKQNEVKPFEISEEEMKEIELKNKLNDEANNELALVNNDNYLPGNNIFESLVPENNSLVRFVKKSKNKLWWKLLIFFGSIAAVSVIGYFAGQSIYNIVKNKKSNDLKFEYQKLISNGIKSAEDFKSEIKRNNRLTRDSEIVYAIEQAIFSAVVENAKDQGWQEYKRAYDELEKILLFNKGLQKEKIELENDIVNKSLFNIKKIVKNYTDDIIEEKKYLDLLRPIQKQINEWDNEYRVNAKKISITLAKLKNIKKIIDDFYGQSNETLNNRKNLFSSIESFNPNISNGNNVFPSEIYKKYFYENKEIFSFNEAQKKILKDKKITYSVDIDPNDETGIATFKFSYFIDIFGEKVKIHNYEIKKEINNLKKFEFEHEKLPVLTPKNNYEFDTTNFIEFVNTLLRDVNSDYFNRLQSGINITYPDSNFKYKLFFDRNSIVSNTETSITIKYKLVYSIPWRFDPLTKNLEYKEIKSLTEYEQILDYKDIAELNFRYKNFNAKIKSINDKNEKFLNDMNKQLNSFSDSDLLKIVYEKYNSVSEQISKLNEKYVPTNDLEGLEKEIAKIDKEITNLKNEILEKFNVRKLAKEELGRNIEEINLFAENNIKKWISSEDKYKEVRKQIGEALEILSRVETDVNVYRNESNKLINFLQKIKDWSRIKDGYLDDMQKDIDNFVDNWVIKNITADLNREYYSEVYAFVNKWQDKIRYQLGKSIDSATIEQELDKAFKELKEKIRDWKSKIDDKNDFKDKFKKSIAEFRSLILREYNYQNDQSKLVYKTLFDQANTFIASANESISPILDKSFDEIKQARLKFNKEVQEFNRKIIELTNQKKQEALKNLNDLKNLLLSSITGVNIKQDSEDIIEPFKNEMDNMKEIIEGEQNNKAHLHVQNNEKASKILNKYMNLYNEKQNVRLNIISKINKAKARYDQIQNDEKYKDKLSSFKQSIDATEAFLQKEIYINISVLKAEENKMDQLLQQMNN
ncbi:MAG: hypothetical protein ACTTJO_00230 [Metamycoplasmataceae bacterium]